MVFKASGPEVGFPGVSEISCRSTYTWLVVLEMRIRAEEEKSIQLIEFHE